MMTTLTKIFELIIIPLLSLLSIYLIICIDKKSKELQDRIDNETADKYIAMLADTITSCVIATKQTYVDSLKAQGKFDLEAQKIAFEMTYTNIMDILSNEAVTYLSTIYGDLEKYIKEKIETEVHFSK